MRGLLAAGFVGELLGQQSLLRDRADAALRACADEKGADLLARLVAVAVVLPQQLGPGAVGEFFLYSFIICF